MIISKDKDIPYRNVNVNHVAVYEGITGEID